MSEPIDMRERMPSDGSANPAARFAEEQVMLCLSGLAYRGFHDAGTSTASVELTRAAIERGFAALAPLRGRFELVWGPVLYRGPLSLFDQQLAYVARDRSVRNRYVIVLRGTNPISTWDWLFGDLWTGRQ